MMIRVFILIFSYLGLLHSSETLFAPLPKSMALQQDKVELGKMLYHDPLLSKDETISCATCHPLENYGVDNLAKSIGISQQEGQRNVPTVYNARFNFKQLWDGRAKNLSEQALLAIENPLEMGASLPELVEKLRRSDYGKRFEAIYEDGVSAKNLADTIAEFEKTLITPDSKFDRYLQGDTNALNTREREGLALFKSKGCVACHNGRNIGGTLFQKIGIFYQDSTLTADEGRYVLSGEKEDMNVFKVPSLRNIEKTAPYFHDGSVERLEDAVHLMALLELGWALDEDEMQKIVSFLKTLTGTPNE